MAHNPKLQVFRIELNPRARTNTACFRDVLTKKLNFTAKDEHSLRNAYWQAFVRCIDLEFFKDEKTKKAFTVYNEGENGIIHLCPDKDVLEGVIKGGKYDRERDIAKIDNKDDVEKIDKDNVILDQFYFLLHTPIDNTKGILLLQTYTEDSIYDVFRKFLITFFRCVEDYFDLKIESFVPQQLKDEYKKFARLKGFSFSKREIIGNVGEDVKEESEEFEVSIKITPKKDTKLSRIQELLQKIGGVKFNDQELNNYSKRVYLADKEDNGAYYDVEKDIEHIKPTIYLENVISVNAETGLPNFDELKTYSFDLLNKINLEILQNEMIHEAAVLS